MAPRLLSALESDSKIVSWFKLDSEICDGNLLFEENMRPVQGSRQNGHDVTSSRRHSECSSSFSRPTYKRSISDGSISYCGLHTYSQTDIRLHTHGHLKDCKKLESTRRLFSVFVSLFRNESKPGNGVTKPPSNSNVQDYNSKTLDAAEHCLLYKLKASKLWCKRPFCSTNINSIATYLIIFSIIGCVVYDIRLCYIILYLWIIIGFFKDVKNINVCPEKDKIHLYEKYITINAFSNVGDKSYLHWSFKDNLSWLWQMQPRRVSLEVFPSNLNLYFQNSENGNASESMNIEWLRLKSFAAQRSINVRPIRLARAGFYYTGTSDEVRCYSCGKRRSNWVAGEDPNEIHKQISPGCRHVNGTDDTNIAIPRDSNVTHSSESPMAASHSQARNDEERHFKNGFRNMSDGNLQNENCRGNHQHPNTQSRNEYTYQENPSLEQHTSERNAVPKPVSQPRQQYPHVTNHMAIPTQSNIPTAYSSAAHDSLDFRTQQTNHHANIQNGHSFEEVRVSNGYNTGIVPQTNVNSSPVLNQPDRRSAAHRNNTGSTSASGSVSDSVVKKLAPLGVNFDKPKYPAYAVLTVRMSSFKGWSGSQTPNLMSEAGFVYAGYADYTRCFFCGGGLRNWEDGDDPWVEHARWFPGCAYLRQNKGAAFIRLVHERMDAQEQVNDKTSGKSRGKVCERPTEELPSDTEVDNLPAFQSVVEQGYSPDLARQVVRQLWTKGISNVHSADILAEILRIAEGEENTDDPRLENTHNEGVPDTNIDDSEEREIQRLVEENRRLRREKMCRICEEEDASIAFLPCAHLVCCHVCAQAVRRCPVCGVIIQGTVKTWFT
ncbi:E3 ubiquitin-protein ligase XIAP [Mizuhopecten yessoensis]|uniref:E3 ubiquitin-protein ligase XIAP n=1 Tax=Mizuhopecten yessoensis TaxID=6573 RepID=A0A210Q9W7_MIZYE|nr:E3 ubiquitin-protein ligase XIAP [Mizuhopecten yessoensis]